MKVIEPTPSQAAVAVQKLLKKNGVEVKLGVAQEAIAVSRGYPSWNVLAADVPTRARKKKPSAQQAQPAAVPAPEETEPAHPGPWLKYLISRSVEAKNDAGAEDLHATFDHELEETQLLKDWRRQSGRDECAMEAASPFVQISYDRQWSPRFGTELVFTIRDHRVQCYVRTWEFKDGLTPSRNYGIFKEQDGRFDTDATVPDIHEPLSALVLNALKEAERHKRDLAAEVNIS